MKFSFLGLGNLGKPLAENILRIGEPLMVYSRRKEIEKYFIDQGASCAKEVFELASCDVLCTCLPMPKDVVEAAIGKDNLYALMKAGAMHVDFSTIDPATAKSLAVAAKKYDLSYVQCTVSKTPQIAAQGNAPFFVGGDENAVSRIMPVLEKIGKPKNLKTLEAACGVKLLSNLVGMSNVAILAECVRICELAGMNLREVVELLLDTGAASFQMKVRGPMMADDDFTAKFGLDLAAKDLGLGCKMAADLGYEPKMMRQALEYLRRASAAGLGGEDVCALYKILGK